MRHYNVRDVEAEFLDEVYRGVDTEPGLLPVEPENFEKGAITGDFIVMKRGRSATTWRDACMLSMLL